MSKLDLLVNQNSAQTWGTESSCYILPGRMDPSHLGHCPVHQPEVWTLAPIPQLVGQGEAEAEVVELDPRWKKHQTSDVSKPTKNIKKQLHIR